MYRPVLVTPPAIKPVTLTEAKAHLDISYTEKDTQIGVLIAAATSYLDGWTGVLGRALCQQTWRQDFDGFYCWSNVAAGRSYGVDRIYGLRLRLPLYPVISITSVKYTDANAVEQTIAGANYTLKEDDLGAYVEFITTYTFPTVGPESASVRVAYLAGYADSNGVSTAPDAIRQAILILVRHWFDNPSAVAFGTIVTKMPFAVEALIAPYRRIKF